mgnify:CR=1 FL=1
MFESLQERLGSILNGLTGRGALSEADVSAALREVRRALLEADVALEVVRAFTDRVREKAVGAEILKSIKPGQMVVKIVHDELVEMLGTESSTVDLNAPAPVVIMMVGLQGSGKTTTLYTSLKQLATPQVNVCTIEDPIEMIDGSFNQMQVQAGIDLNFADGIRALMRQDPDIIMVGEIRDLETAEVAVQAALTGHLVLSTLHTNDAPSAITRLLDLGLPSYLLKAVIIGVVAQRLVRRLCPHCKRAVEMDPDRWYDITGGAALLPPETAYEPVGCLECRETGYLGRVGIYEIMPLSLHLKSLVHDQTDGVQLRQHAVAEGMTPLRMAGCRKIAEGLTSVEEVLGVAMLERS